MRLRISLIAIVLTASAVLLGTPGAAVAAETAQPPSHLTVYNLDWLNYLAPEDMPGTRYAVCVVDSGTLVTPDTPPANTAGPILERLAIDGGEGTPQGDGDFFRHGTHMAMHVNAPINDWGTIGTATWIPAITVRATYGSADSFSYDQGVERCRQAVERHPVAAVSLSLGTEPSAEEELSIDDTVERAHLRGLSVVAAAGNTAGGPTHVPAALPGVFAVAAGGPAGGLCAYSSFDQRVDVIGPACPVEFGDPFTGQPYSTMGGGSSTATVVTATLIAALRSLRPDATYDQVENWVRDSARVVDGRPVLDGELAANAAGLQAVVARANDRIPTVTPAPTATPEPTATRTPRPTPAPSPTVERLARPKHASGRYQRKRLSMTVARVPRGSTLHALIEQHGELGVTTRRTREVGRSRRLVVRLPWRPDRITLYLASVREFGPARSPSVVLHRTPANRFR